MEETRVHEHTQWLTDLKTGCLEMELNRGLQPRSLEELDRYLSGFVSYGTDQAVEKPDDLTPDFLRQYVLWRCEGFGPSLVKGTVWSLRKLGNYMVLKQVVTNNPAAGLQHPKISPKSKLPKYLKSLELKALLENAARERDPCDLVILSLMTTTGMRPNDVACLKREDINLEQQRIDHRTKGGWRKGTPLSLSMTSLLADYLSNRESSCDAAFVNSRLKPVTVHWIQRMVRAAGEQAGLGFRLTSNHLRHTFATHAADRHGKVVTKALLGHSSLTRTEVYMHLSARRFKAVARLHPYQNSFSLGVVDG